MAGPNIVSPMRKYSGSCLWLYAWSTRAGRLVHTPILLSNAPNSGSLSASLALEHRLVSEDDGEGGAKIGKIGTSTCGKSIVVFVIIVIVGVLRPFTSKLLLLLVRSSLIEAGVSQKF